MKVFVASDSQEKGSFSDNSYHWCESGEILMFGLFQIEEDKDVNNNSMCGIQSRKFTTFIEVKNLKISKEFYRELIKESIETSFETKIDDKGNFQVDFTSSKYKNPVFAFNIHVLIEELIEKARKFKNGDKIRVENRDVFKM